MSIKDAAVAAPTVCFGERCVKGGDSLNHDYICCGGGGVPQKIKEVVSRVSVCGSHSSSLVFEEEIEWSVVRILHPMATAFSTFYLSVKIRSLPL